jgi:hypothetical protein
MATAREAMAAMQTIATVLVEAAWEVGAAVVISHIKAELPVPDK